MIGSSSYFTFSPRLCHSSGIQQERAGGKTVIIILGSPNDPKGNLSAMARERLEAGLALFRRNPECRILLTGGWGPHFNVSELPHAAYAQRFLEGRGVSPESFLPHAISSNTIEDAEKSRLILSGAAPRKVLVVTSDFHLERARRIFGKTFSGWELGFHGAPHQAGAGRRKELLEHERRAIARLEEAGDFQR